MKKFLKLNSYTLPIGGLYRYRKSGEDHQHQGNLIHLLQVQLEVVLTNYTKNILQVFITYQL